MTYNKENIETIITDAMIDKPCAFKVANTYIYIYYPSFGKFKLIERLFKQIKFNTDNLSSLPFLEYLRITEAHKNIVLRILSYHTINQKDKLFDESYVKKRIGFLRSSLNNSELAELLMFSSCMIDIPAFMEVLGITKENEKRKAICKIKNEKGSTITLGGVSDYGNIITRACELFHCGWNEVVWGINYVNLILSLNDAQSTVFLNDDERKRLPKSFFIQTEDNDIIDAGNPNAWKEIRNMKFD